MSDTSKATPSLFPRNVVIVGGENDHSFRCVGRWIVVPEEDFQAAVERDKLARELAEMIGVAREFRERMQSIPADWDAIEDKARQLLKLHEEEKVVP